MKYRSTRGGGAELSGAKAIIKGIADDKGLFVPACIPELPFKIEDMTDAGYRDVAKAVIGAFFDDYTEEEMAACVNGAYDRKFTASDIVEISEAGGAYFLELFHGKTAAFKDMALSILPYLLTTAVKKEKEEAKICILTATSGDTGKAALEGFAPEIKHFSDQGISPVVIHQQNTFRIIRKCVPADDVLQMPESLDAADHLNAESGGIGVDLPHFLQRITAAQITEIGFLRKLIGIFGIKHDHVIAEQSQAAQPFLEVGNFHDGIARTVQHNAESLEHHVSGNRSACKCIADSPRRRLKRAILNDDCSRLRRHPENTRFRDLFKPDSHSVATVGNWVFLRQHREHTVDLRRSFGTIPDKTISTHEKNPFFIFQGIVFIVLRYNITM